MTGYKILDPLVSPFGVVSRVGERDNPMSSAGLLSYGSSIGSGTPGHGVPKAHHVYCSGKAWQQPDKARLIAIAEAAERYAGADILGERRTWARVEDLPGDRLEPERYPRCSATELAHPGCRIRPFDPAEPIRWVRGLDLVSDRAVWIPAVMACYGLHDPVPAELFTHRISTGFAVHTDPREAVVRGICEVIERDMVAVVWLQRLSLPTVDPVLHSATTSALLTWLAQRFVRVHLLDATSDLGVPTVYCLAVAEHDPRVARVISAGTGSSLTEAADKALKEIMGMREYLHGSEAPATPEEFAGIEDAASYMGLAERAEAFDFLTAHPRVSENRPWLPDDPAQALTELTKRLGAAGMRPVVIDRTPAELRRVGLTAVNVVIPDLQPMSLNPLAQFKAHPRLYEAPRRMGYRVLSEEELNPWPQPFA